MICQVCGRPVDALCVACGQEEGSTLPDEDEQLEWVTVPDTPLVRTCSVCGGSGVIAGPDSFGNYDPCDACEGSGTEDET